MYKEKLIFTFSVFSYKIIPIVLYLIFLVSTNNIAQILFKIILMIKVNFSNGDILFHNGPKNESLLAKNIIFIILIIDYLHNNIITIFYLFLNFIIEIYRKNLILFSKKSFEILCFKLFF